jgi:hypothetical protein
MPDLPQRWLSLNGIATVLNLTPTQVKTLYKQKLLVRIGKRPQEYRYLDPTPEYAERLRLTAGMFFEGRHSGMRVDLPYSFILTSKEVAEIMGWSWQHADKVLRGNVKRYKAPNRIVFFSVATVRSMIWKRHGRKLAEKTSPFLLPELIAYAQRLIASETALVPTDEEVKADAEIQKKMEWMLKQPQREIMLQDYLSKMDLAKRVLSATAGPGESDTRR